MHSISWASDIVFFDENFVSMLGSHGHGSIETTVCRKVGQMVTGR